MRKRHKYLLISTVVLAAAIIPIIAFLPAQKQTAYLNPNVPTESLTYKTVAFGFNLGFLGDLNQQGTSFLNGPLQQIKSDGITNVRVYEPFTTNLVKNPSFGPSNLAWLTNQGFHVLLSLSNYPNVSSIKYDKSVAPKDASETSYTNRYPPADVQGQYIPYLMNYLDTLPSGVIANTDFEIGNEPDSPDFFWGTPAKFTEIATATKTALQKYNRPIYCCGFTSDFSDGTATRDPGYAALLNDNTFYTGVNLSFHSYQYSNTNFSNISLPHEQNSIISEFNLWSYQKQDTTNRIATMNSPTFTAWIIQMLDYAYSHDIKRAYVFNLADNPDKSGALGLFDSTGQPKPAYTYFKTIYDVVKDGYAVDDSDSAIHLVGKTKSAWFAKNGAITLPATETVLSMSDSNAPVNLTDVHSVANGQWAITQTIVPPVDTTTDPSNSENSGSGDSSSGGGVQPPISGGGGSVSSGGGSGGQIPTPAPTPAPVPTQPPSSTLQVRVTVPLVLNFRASPGGPIIGLLKHGTQITVLQNQPDTSGAWLYVSTQTGQSGYVYAVYTAPLGTATSNRYRVSAILANIRSSPNYGPIIGMVKYGTLGTLLSGSPTDTWIRIQFDNGLTGYIYRTLTTPQ